MSDYQYIPTHYSSGMPHEQEDAFLDDRVVIKLVEGAYALVSKTDGKYDVALGTLMWGNPPLDLNGLARCGCGNQLSLVQARFDDEKTCSRAVLCLNPECGWTLEHYCTKKQIIEKANTAMGVKEGK